MRTVRKILRINADLCDGCGQCVAPCLEGAIEIVDGKARVKSENMCDGAGVCIGVCPKGALTIEEREAEEFDVYAVLESQKAQPAINQRNVDISCFNCSATDDVVVLFPCRRLGEDTWVCAHCLPQLIHG